MKILFVCLLTLAVIPLTAQTNITVTYTSGKVYYYPPNQAKPVAIYAGKTLSSEGKVRCDAKAKVKLLCNGKIFEFSETKVHPLAELAQESKSPGTLNFAGRFWKFLSGSMEGSEDENHLKEQEESQHAGVKGWGTGDYAIQTDRVLDGNFSDQAVEFKWTAPAGTLCCFRLTRQSDEALVLEAWTQGNVLHLNPAELALEDGGRYEWQISTAQKEATAPKSRKMSFVYQPKLAARALTEAGAQPAFQTATPVEQALMKCFALEDKGFSYDASRQYAQLAADKPDNGLVKRAYAAFLARMGQLEAASALIK
ncbi:MAG: hypothetical protein ABIO24_07235 [Saprospiraceae bacterium]